MYDPKGNGKDRTVQTVRFAEFEPPAHLRGIVHRYIELRTTGPLAEDYRFHALPDACTYVVFDQLDRSVTGAARLRAKSEEFNLGRQFHFLNIRFLPGVWNDKVEPVLGGMVDRSYSGDMPYNKIATMLAGQDVDAQLDTLTQLVEHLVARGVVGPNDITARIFQNLDDIGSVADMAEITGLSARQLQRRLKQSAGFAPHDLLKILRLQQSLDGTASWSYADQSHFIHAFRNATGYTPGKYAKNFDV